MTGVVTCACCGSPISAEVGPIQLADDGFPVASSIREGLGLPLIDVCACRGFEVLLDGKKVDRAVAFDRAAGVIWRLQTIDDRIVSRDGEVLVEQLTGVVTLRPVQLD